MSLRTMNRLELNFCMLHRTRAGIKNIREKKICGYVRDKATNPLPIDKTIDIKNRDKKTKKFELGFASLIWVWAEKSVRLSHAFYEN